MRKEKNEEQSVYDIGTKRKWISIVGFLISIVLLSIAITLSMNEEKVAREAKINLERLNSQNKISSNVIVLEQASSDLNKDINQVKESSGNANNGNTIEANSTDNEISASGNLSSNNSVEGENAANDLAVENKVINTNVDNNNSNDENANNQTGNETNQNNNKPTNAEETKPVEQFIKPVEGEHLTSYSMDSLVYSNTLQEWITHRGIDIKAEKTTVVKASAGGTIKSIKNDPRYGLSIIIEHSDGFETVYSSLLSTEFVKEGDKVEQGQSIGTVGNSAVFETAEGSHLHFEILKNGEYINPDIYVK